MRQVASAKDIVDDDKKALDRGPSCCLRKAREEVGPKTCGPPMPAFRLRSVKFQIDNSQISRPRRRRRLRPWHKSTASVQSDFYYERSSSSKVGDDDSFGVALNYPNEPWYGDLTVKQVGENFTPALGFVNRQGVQLYDGTVGYLARYRNNPVRTFGVSTRNQVFIALNGELESRQSQINAEILTASDHDVSFSAINSFEHLSVPFTAPRNIIVPAGNYGWTNLFAHWQSPVGAPISLLAEVTCCSYYNGSNVQGHFQLNYRPNQYYELGANYDPSFISLPASKVDIQVLALSGNLNFTPDMQVGFQAQYDNISQTVGFLARYRWEFLPGSNILVAIGQSAVIPGSTFQAQTTQASLRVTHTLRF